MTTVNKLPSDFSESLSENFERPFNFGLKPALTPALSMNLDFKGTQPAVTEEKKS
jgi:hypothetical protein